MQLRANHLTISRMLLLPIPSYLLFGGTVDRLIALVAFTLLALTDWWDGKIARKQGPTVLGGLLDPIADKMFLAFTYLPMACIEAEVGSGLPIVPVWMITLMFFRELSVTGMRSLAATHGIEFKTATLAKFKTAFQMGGGGVIFWFVIFQDNHTVIVGGISGLVVMALGIALFRKIRGRGVGLKVWTQVAAYAICVALAVFLPIRWCLNIVAFAILALTLVSGAQYAHRVFAGLKELGWPSKFHEIALSLAEGAFPVALVALLFIPGVPVWALIGLLTAELAAGGLCDLLATEKSKRRAWLAWVRCLVLAAAGTLGWLSVTLWNDLALTFMCIVIAMAASAAYCAGLFIFHRHLYLR